VGLASRGLRDMDAGIERISDEVELLSVRAQARRVLLESLVATVVTTALALLLP